jgi:putative transposase
MLEQHRKRAVKFNVEGHAHFLTFSCHQRLPLLTNDHWRWMLADSLRQACDDHEVALWAYVFMPEHVHLLLKPRRKRYDLSKFEHAAKTSSAKLILNDLRRKNAAVLQRLIVDERPGKTCYRLWLAGGGHDLNIWSLDKAIEKANYCHRNPVKRGLVNDPVKWHWSSFRWLEFGARKGEPLKVDDWDERLVDG